MSTRWAGVALCTLIAGPSILVGTMGGLPAEADGTAPTVSTTAGDPAAGAAVVAPPLTLTSQTPWVTATEPWFNIALGVSGAAGPASGLRISLTFYSRIDDASQLQQAVNGTPGTPALLHLPDITVSQTGTSLDPSACVTVIPEPSATTPPAGNGVSAAGSPVLSLDCQPDTGTCGDVYPVSVALVRVGQSAAVSRFTTFLTYQEPHGPVGQGGPLRSVWWSPPEAARWASTPLSARSPTTATSPRPSPSARPRWPRSNGRVGAAGMRALSQLSELSGTEILDQSFVPINVAALSEAGLAGEIGFQVDRGDELLRGAGLKPSSSTGSMPRPPSPRPMPGIWLPGSRWRGPPGSYSATPTWPRAA